MYTVEAPVPSVHTRQPHTHTYTLHTVTIKEVHVFGLLNELNKSQSMGPDEMYPRLPNELASFVANPSRIYSNLSVTQGRLPKD